MAVDHIYSRTILNIAYLSMLTISTLLLYDTVIEHETAETVLSSKDWVFVGVYGFPTGICIAGVVLYLYINCIWICCSCRGDCDDYFSELNILFVVFLIVHIIFCGKYKVHHIIPERDYCVIILNGISLFLAMLVFIVFVPIYVVFLMYHKHHSVRTFGWLFQCFICFINVTLHMILLDHFGYYSLGIILCGIFYLIFSSSFFSRSRVWQTSWIILEFMLFVTMLTITFMVKYDDHLIHSVVIGLFVLYILCCLPVIKWLLLKCCRDKLSSDEVCQFLIESYPAVSDIEDRFYCLLCALTNGHNTNRSWRSVSSNYISMDLLPGKNAKSHQDSLGRFKMLWNFYRSDRRIKRKMINPLHSGRNEEIVAWIGIVLYIVLSFVLFLYPMAWYLYIWIYRNMLSTEQSPILHNDDLSAQYLFVWIIGGIYSFLFSIGLIMVIVHICNGEVKATTEKLNVIIFAWSLCVSDHPITLSAAYKLLQRLITVGMILELETLDFDEGLIILNYLYG